jgi:inorganic triphosphatase YgiF
MERSRHMSEENKAETRRFIEEGLNQGNLDVLDELVPPEWVHHDPASPEEERGPEGVLRQRREISEPLKGNAKTPKVTRGPVGERVRRLAGARDLRPLFKVRTRRRIFELLAVGADGNIAVGEIALDESEIFGETPAHLSRIEVETDSNASLHAGVAEFMDEMRDGLGLRPTGLAKFELGLSAAALNPSGASILDLKQRTEPSNEKAGG